IDTNPANDETGAFAATNQKGPVWFLAGTFGDGQAHRTVTIPAGKNIFFPINSSVFWAPQNLDYPDFVATQLGLDPNTLSVKKKLLLASEQDVIDVVELRIVIDGANVANPEQYYTESSLFKFPHTDLLDSLGVPVTPQSRAAAAGYYAL